MGCRRTVIIMSWLAVFGVGWLVAQSDEIKSDEQTLKSAGIGSEGPALLAYLRKAVEADGAAARIKDLVKQLGDANLEKRESATAELTKLGAPAVPYLRQALRNGDAESRDRAQRCLKEVDKDPGDAVPLAVLRLLAERRPEGAAELLLAYLPLVSDDALADEVRATLAAVGFRDGRPQKVLVDALADKDPEIRATAAEIIGKRPAHFADVKRLLKDSDPVVRLRAAQVLADLRDADVVPVLIALLVELPAERALQAVAALQ